MLYAQKRSRLIYQHEFLVYQVSKNNGNYFKDCILEISAQTVKKLQSVKPLCGW